MSKSPPSRLDMMFPRREIQAYREWLCLGYLWLGIGILRLAGELAFASGLLDTGNDMPPQLVVYWRELPGADGFLLVLGVIDYAVDLVLSGLLSAMVLWRFLFAPGSTKIRIYFLCLSLYIVPWFICYPIEIRYSSYFQLLALAFLRAVFMAVGVLSFRSGVKDMIRRKIGR